jgi:hypothetical protein
MRMYCGFRVSTFSDANAGAIRYKMVEIGGLLIAVCVDILSWNMKINLRLMHRDEMREDLILPFRSNNFIHKYDCMHHF